MFQINFTPESIDDLRIFRKHDQQRIVAESEEQLRHQPWWQREIKSVFARIGWLNGN